MSGSGNQQPKGIASDGSRVRALIPFLLPSGLSNGLVMGRGVIMQYVLPTANADFTFAHPLGRIPTLAPIALDNGFAYLPRTRRSTVTAFTSTHVTFQVDTACVAPGCFFWLV